MLPTNALGAPTPAQVAQILAENGNPTAIGYMIEWDRTVTPAEPLVYTLITTDGQFEIACKGTYAGMVVSASAYYSLPSPEVRTSHGVTVVPDSTGSHLLP